MGHEDGKVNRSESDSKQIMGSPNRLEANRFDVY